MKKIIILLSSLCSLFLISVIILSIFLIQSNNKLKIKEEELNNIEEEQKVEYINGHPVLTIDNTIPGEAYYFLYLTTDESKLNKNYTVDDFNLPGLDEVLELNKINNYNDLYNKNNYNKLLRLHFINHNDFKEIKIRRELFNDKRVLNFNKNLDFNFGHSRYGANLKFFETNLNIKNISWIGRAVDVFNQGMIIDNFETFNELKNKYSNVSNQNLYIDSMAYNYCFFTAVELSAFENIDGNYFDNNTLIYLNIDYSTGSDVIINSLYENDNSYELNLTKCNYPTGSFDDLTSISYLIEIEGKLDNKTINFNENSYRTY